MQVESLSPIQSLYSRARSSAARTADIGRQSGKAFAPPSISDAARLKLAAEQQAAGGTQSGDLPIGIKHMLQRIVDDPGYGAEMAEGYATSVHTAPMTIEQYLQVKDTLQTGQQQLQAAWQTIRGEGKSPGQSFADLLTYELSLPQSYWDAQDPGHSVSDIRGLAQAKLDYLQQYLAAAAA